MSCIQQDEPRVSIDIDYDSEDRVFFHELGGDDV